MAKFNLTASVKDLSSYRASIIRNEKIERSLDKHISNYEKEKDPLYSLIKVDFNTTSRRAKVYFNQSQEYRTIEKYVQRNYTKYPIYSDWKIKNKTIFYLIKLTNENIETLYQNENPLIKIFANEIVCNLNNDDLLPSWFKKKTLNTYYEEAKNEEIENRNSMRIKFNNNLKIENKDLDKIMITIRKIDKRKLKYSKKILKLTRKMIFFNKNEKNILLGIITFGIYFYFKSNKHFRALEKRSKKLVNIIKKTEVEYEKTIEDKNNIELDIKKLQNDEDSDIRVHKKMLKKLLDVYNERYNSIVPLGVECNNFTNFIPLKLFLGYKYKKIVGCYVILNNELKKCYVGQSKDIMHRLKQHFNGTVPNNIIFAEDYFNSAFQNKEDLFNVKIIPLQTKDQLDANEKYLIEKYDAFESGYNRTSGNI